MLTTLRNPRTDLPWLITLHAVAFVGFHGVVAVNSSLWFNQLVWLKNDWLADLVGIWGFMIWTYGFTLYFAWLVIRTKGNQMVAIVCFAAAFYASYEHRYPAATALLVEVGQFDSLFALVIDQRPPLSEVIKVDQERFQ